MQVFISLDYELFFGSRTGSVVNCLLRPTAELAAIAGRHGVFLSLFVDALYLYRLAEETSRHPSLQQDYDAIRSQLTNLKKAGHDIQLHLHPHWIDSRFDGNGWHLDTRRYKLHDFPPAQIHELVSTGKKLLTDIIGNTVFAYRAGGWCLQPFSQISQALLANGIWIDSTVFPGGVSDDADRSFNFVSAPVEDYWRFTNDPNIIDTNGFFLELPISALWVTPLLFWRMILHRKLMPQALHRTFGDGSTLSWGMRYYLQKLLHSTVIAVSIDGQKTGLLEKAYLQEKSQGRNIFHVMGHPKAASRHSMKQLDRFLETFGPFNGITFQDFHHLQP